MVELVRMHAELQVRFEWLPPISLSLTQVTQEGFESCDGNDGNLIKTWSPRTTEGTVDIGSLPVGLNYFISKHDESYGVCFKSLQFFFKKKQTLAPHV